MKKIMLFVGLLLSMNCFAVESFWITTDTGMLYIGGQLAGNSTVQSDIFQVQCPSAPNGVKSRLTYNVRDNSGNPGTTIDIAAAKGVEIKSVADIPNNDNVTSTSPSIRQGAGLYILSITKSGPIGYTGSYDAAVWCANDVDGTVIPMEYSNVTPLDSTKGHFYQLQDQ
jgi:hypothetical protein